MNQGHHEQEMPSSSMSRRFRQVDVFGEDWCTGNPVAVVFDAEGLDNETMRRFAVWSNLSECTFVLPPTQPGADYRVRIFTLNIELPFAGHPTLGTVRAWLDAGGRPATPGVVVQECGAGLIPVRVDGELLAFAAPPRIRSGPVDAETLTAVIDILGVDREKVVDAEWLDNGPGWVGVLLDSARTVLELRPDVSAHPGRWDIGVIGQHDSQAETCFELRAFSTEAGEPLREDPVTGSLNAAAAEWLLSRGRASAPYLASQGTAMGRRGRIHVSTEDGRIWVGGRAEVVLSGTAAL
jgi:PhzF family phenazine biosynthesis protein